MVKQIRTIASEIRALEAGEDKLTIGGLAVPYGVRTTLWDDGDMELREEILPGAFTDSIGSRDQHCLWQHDSAIVLGRKGAGTLRLAEGDGGVDFEADLPDSPEGQSKYATIARGDINQVSFGFNDVDVDELRETVDGKRIYTRMVKKAELWEVSPVTWAAYGDGTNVAARGGITELVNRAAKLFESGAPEDERGSADLVERSLSTKAAELYLIKES